MKRDIIVIVFITIFLALSLTACAENNPAKQPATEEPVFIAEELADTPAEDEGKYQIAIYSFDYPKYNSPDEYTFIVDCLLNEYAINAIHIKIPKDYDEKTLADNLEFIERENIKAV